MVRRNFIGALRQELPAALRELQQGSIAPVDLAQAAIGPGMAIYSRYSKVIEPDGSAMRVRTALALINQVLGEVLAEQESDFDPTTRWCVKWFEERGFDPGKYGQAEVLATATNVAISGLEHDGVVNARRGEVRLLRPEELPPGYDPATDDRVSVWEVVVHLSHRLKTQGMTPAAQFMARARDAVDLDAAKELAYLLYSICERKGWADKALLFNGLGTSWADLYQQSKDLPGAPALDTLPYDDESER